MSLRHGMHRLSPPQSASVRFIPAFGSRPLHTSPLRSTRRPGGKALANPLCARLRLFLAPIRRDWLPPAVTPSGGPLR